MIIDCNTEEGQGRIADIRKVLIQKRANRQSGKEKKRLKLEEKVRRRGAPPAAAEHETHRKNGRDGEAGNKAKMRFRPERRLADQHSLCDSDVAKSFSVASTAGPPDSVVPKIDRTPHRPIPSLDLKGVVKNDKSKASSPGTAGERGGGQRPGGTTAGPSHAAVRRTPAGSPRSSVGQTSARTVPNDVVPPYPNVGPPSSARTLPNDRSNVGDRNPSSSSKQSVSPQCSAPLSETNVNRLNHETQGACHPFFLDAYLQQGGGHYYQQYEGGAPAVLLPQATAPAMRHLMECTPYSKQSSISDMLPVREYGAGRREVGGGSTTNRPPGGVMPQKQGLCNEDRARMENGARVPAVSSVACTPMTAAPTPLTSGHLTCVLPSPMSMSGSASMSNCNDLSKFVDSCAGPAPAAHRGAPTADTTTRFGLEQVPSSGVDKRGPSRLFPPPTENPEHSSFTPSCPQNSSPVQRPRQSKRNTADFADFCSTGTAGALSSVVGGAAGGSTVGSHNGVMQYNSIVEKIRPHQRRITSFSDAGPPDPHPAVQPNSRMSNPGAAPSMGQNSGHRELPGGRNSAQHQQNSAASQQHQQHQQHQMQQQQQQQQQQPGLMRGQGMIGGAFRGQSMIAPFAMQPNMQLHGGSMIEVGGSLMESSGCVMDRVRMFSRGNE